MTDPYLSKSLEYNLLFLSLNVKKQRPEKNRIRNKLEQNVHVKLRFLMYFTL